jgi:hypothetical protein
MFFFPQIFSVAAGAPVVKINRDVTLDDFLREVLRWQIKWLQVRVRRSYSLKAKLNEK